jgi:hypothetical protein
MCRLHGRQADHEQSKRIGARNGDWTFENQ